MLPVVRADTAGTSPSATGSRGAGGRSGATADNQPVIAFGPTESSDAEATAAHLLGDKGDQQERPGQGTPSSFFGRLQTPSEAFAAALNIKPQDEATDKQGNDSTNRSRPFSGLAVRAVNLYETTALFLADKPPRGGAVDATS